MASDAAWPPLAYDVSAYELAPRLRASGDRVWTLDEAMSALASRVAVEKQRRELHVYYYRIGHTLAFPLPLTQRPSTQLLPPGASVRRDVWLIPGKVPAVVVRDELAGLAAGVEVRTHWLGGTHLAWSFTGDWARLSDGEQALWIGTSHGALEAGKLALHEGSRGPLALEHATTLPEGKETRWWVFRCDTATGWEPPRLTVEGDVLKVGVPGAEADTWTLP